ncbi:MULTISPECIES: hypothetical protein [Rhodobacterales]|uniref:Uncharacterized protein n=2 Tax=Rhodobacterales TaxID=204455 RepID=A0A0A0E9Q8_9RHOB|nr:MULTISPECIES: hypothetical protein [Rhodobacterales]KGM46910.1 hypothetical protein ATO9_21110 [Pseudooceanicola atlanticus]MEC7761661.1 hypothetical protein [Pseudomonadota bacterium]GGE48064.1 hypothetical protein GCM10011360_39000 [Primorskyibacter flagellatus]
MSLSPVLDISIDPELHPCIPAALLRLGYLYPELDFLVSDKGVAVHGASGSDLARLKREVTYQVYREKVFRQTLSMRQSLYAMLAG